MLVAIVETNYGATVVNDISIESGQTANDSSC